VQTNEESQGQSCHYSAVALLQMSFPVVGARLHSVLELPSGFYRGEVLRLPCRLREGGRAFGEGVQKRGREADAEDHRELAQLLHFHQSSGGVADTEHSGESTCWYFSTSYR
jgi:hypothetical protein